VEGAALAISILDEVRKRGALCAATTHYAELKAYAIETEDVINASCEFDVETLRPTYRLMIGTPGKSNAFAISEKLGLQKNIVDRARRYVDAGSRNFEAVIEKLENTRMQLEAEQAEAAQLRREYEEFKAKAERKLSDKLGRAERDAEKMLAQAEQMVLSAKATSNYIYDQLDKLQKQRDSEKLAEHLSEAKKNIRARVRDYENAAYSDKEEDEEYVLPRDLVKGDRVRHKKLGTTGVLLETVTVLSTQAEATVDDLQGVSGSSGSSGICGSSGSSGSCGSCGLFLSAASSQAQNHNQSQKDCYELFHSCFLLF
jgi:DNA mismatch repair protein MutS2